MKRKKPQKEAQRKKKRDFEVLEVEKILDRIYGDDGILYYKIKWKGYSEDETTWEPLDNLADCQDKIREFDFTKKGEYIVEAIRSKRIIKDKKVEYKVKWVGYDEEQNTWEPEENILDKNLIFEYESKQSLRKSAQKQILPSLRSFLFFFSFIIIIIILIIIFIEQILIKLFYLLFFIFDSLFVNLIIIINYFLLC